MILLDTDHFSVFTDERDPRHRLLHTRLEAAAEQVACTIVSVEEVLRGLSCLGQCGVDVISLLLAQSRLDKVEVERHFERVQEPLGLSRLHVDDFTRRGAFRGMRGEVANHPHSIDLVAQVRRQVGQNFVNLVCQVPLLRLGDFSQ